MSQFYPNIKRTVCSVSRKTCANDANTPSGKRRFSSKNFASVTLMAILATQVTNALATDSYRVRISTMGDLSGELYTPIAETAGFAGGMVISHADQTAITDKNGDPMSYPVTPFPAGPLGTVGSTSPVRIDFKQQQTNANFVVVYRQPTTGGNNWLYTLNIGAIRANRQFNASHSGPNSAFGGAVPDIATSTIPGLGAGTSAAVSAGIVSAINSGQTARAGEWQAADTELSAAWYARWFSPVGPMRVKAGVTLVAPTGGYEDARGVNAGYGDFYTLRPAASLMYDVTGEVTLAAKASLGLNGKNDTTGYRTGNFMAVELAATRKVGLNTFGVNYINIGQYQDDTAERASDIAEIARQDGRRYKYQALGLFASIPVFSNTTMLNIVYSQSLPGTVRNGVEMRGMQFSLARAF